jgi:uncharacterized protein DUF1580
VRLHMIKLESEHVLSFRRACALLPKLRADRRIAPSTLYRWSTSGLRGVHLETIQVGGTLCTSQEALQRFFDKLAGSKGRGL